MAGDASQSSELFNAYNNNAQVNEILVMVVWGNANPCVDPQCSNTLGYMATWIPNSPTIAKPLANGENPNLFYKNLQNTLAIFGRKHEYIHLLLFFSTLCLLRSGGSGRHERLRCSLGHRGRVTGKSFTF